jgi:hypothetical protein
MVQKLVVGSDFVLLREIMDVMLIGTTSLADCANHAAR